MQWRCRRGLRELDLVFARFLERGVDDLNPEELATFERLLEQNDLEIYDWLLGRSQPPGDDFRRLIARLNQAPS